ncbi:hypothetical protein ANO14919_038510 [Xylariales sp. No.14919]|nr:hypothetical protein ANO14919_038510 [Xylariales sp. No.14919]
MGEGHSDFAEYGLWAKTRKSELQAGVAHAAAMFNIACAVVQCSEKTQE